MELYDFIKRLKDKAIDHHEYFHYTTADKYLRMQTPVKLPNGETHRMFWLTPATSTNDGMERKYGDHAYLGCFTYSPYESVGMWFMYGKERADAIRIGFDQEHFAKWRKANVKSFGERKKTRVFGVSIGANGIPVYSVIPDDQIEDVCFYDVAYVLSKEDVEHHKWPKSVEWRRNYYEVISDDCEIVSERGALLYSNDFTDKTCRKLPFCFKKKGWYNEREVRLVVTLKPETVKWKVIAIPFDEPMECIESDRKGRIILSPWYNQGCDACVVNEDNASRSVFDGELLVKRERSHLLSSAIPKGAPCPIYVQIHTWNDFYRVATWFTSKGNQWVFRGERDKDRELTTSFERKHGEIPVHCCSSSGQQLDKDKFAEYLKSCGGIVSHKESSIIQSFKMMMAWHYMGECWLPYVMAMQHYGGPTRLIDFTYSLFTALFFSFQHDEKPGSRTIWAINLDLIVKWARNSCKIFLTPESKGESNFAEVAERIFKRLITADKSVFSDMAGVIPIPFASNPRMLAQNGLFLMPMRNANFLENLGDVLPCAKYAKSAFYGSVPVVNVESFIENESVSDLGLVRFEFDEKLRKTAKGILLQANIDRTNLFPDTKEDAQMFDRISERLALILKRGMY